MCVCCVIYFSNVLRISDEISIKMIIIIVIFAFYDIIIYQEIWSWLNCMHFEHLLNVLGIFIGLFFLFLVYSFISFIYTYIYTHTHVYCHVSHKAVHLIVLPFMNRILQCWFFCCCFFCCARVMVFIVNGILLLLQLCWCVLSHQRKSVQSTTMYYAVVQPWM